MQILPVLKKNGEKKWCQAPLYSSGPIILFTLSSLPLTINIEMDIKTRVIKINTELVEYDKIKIVATVLQEEGIIAYPTDTFKAGLFIPRAQSDLGTTEF
ncbi:unnamed protein product, partial [marine sediment metagenome]